MNNPFIPSERSNIAIIAGNLKEEIYNHLEYINIKVVKTIAHRAIYSSIEYHPDIVIHPIDEKLLIIEPTVFDYYKEKLKSTNIELIKGETILKSKYPFNIAYNVGRIGNYALHDFRYTDEKLKYYLQKKGVELINVKQGYTKCSMAIISNKSIITSDTVIDEKVRDRGFESLLIKPGYIYLKNQDYGFIGGCTGNISNKEILLTGALKRHPHKVKIENFIRSMHKNIIYLSKEPIEDVGTIITLNGDPI